MDKALEAGARNLRNSIARAEDYAGTLRAEESVKLRPDDWHSVTRLGRELADRVTALAALPATDTSGLVERLRSRAAVRMSLKKPTLAALYDAELDRSAADRIEALEREVAAKDARQAEADANARHWHGEIEAIGAMLGLGAVDAGDVPAAVQALITRAEKAETQRAEAEAEIARYREELGNIANSWTAHGYDNAKNAVEIMKDIAKEALNAQR